MIRIGRKARVTQAYIDWYEREMHPYVPQVTLQDEFFVEAVNNDEVWFVNGNIEFSLGVEQTPEFIEWLED